jgi:hypothetical protein
MKTEIVIAKYYEDITWSEDFIDNRVVYEKCAEPIIENSIHLENKGRETDTYLTYIIDNYDNLPDCIIFTQGDPGLNNQDPSTMHPPNFELANIFPNLQGGYNLANVFREVIDNPNIVKEQGFLPLTFIHPKLYWDETIQTEFPEESKSFDKFNGYGIMNDCFQRHPFDGIYALLDTRVLYSYLFDEKIQEYWYNDGAIFAVSKERVLFHPKEFYEKALDICNNTEKFGISNNLFTTNINLSKVRKTAYYGYEQSNGPSMRVLNNMPCCFERIWSIIFNGITK